MQCYSVLLTQDLLETSTFFPFNKSHHSKSVALYVICHRKYLRYHFISVEMHLFPIGIIYCKHILFHCICHIENAFLGLGIFPSIYENAWTYSSYENIEGFAWLFTSRPHPNPTMPPRLPHPLHYKASYTLSVYANEVSGGILSAKWSLTH